MSQHFSWQSAVLKSGCESTTKYVLLVVGTYMNQHGAGAFPSYATIADSASLHRATVIKHLGLAEEAGWLKVTRRSDKDGESESNLYAISFPAGVVVQNDHLVVQNDWGSRPKRLGVVVQNDPNTPSLTPQVTPHKKHSDLPDWLPEEEWKGFEEMRQKIRKPLTDRAKKMIFAKLDEFRKQGHDPKDVLDQSIVNSWSGIFPLKRVNVTGRPEKFDPVAHVNRNRRSM